MIRAAKNYIVDKITKTITGKIVRYVFWSTVLMLGPIEVVSTVGIPIAVATAAVVHSGVIEIGVSKIVNNKVSSTNENEEYKE